MCLQYAWRLLQHAGCVQASSGGAAAAWPARVTARRRRRRRLAVSASHSVQQSWAVFQHDGPNHLGLRLNQTAGGWRLAAERTIPGHGPIATQQQARFGAVGCVRLAARADDEIEPLVRLLRSAHRFRAESQ